MRLRLSIVFIGVLMIGFASTDLQELFKDREKIFKLIEEFILPPDYEANLKLVPRRRVEHINETFEVVDRFFNLLKLWFQRGEDLYYRYVEDELRDILDAIEFKHECRESVARMFRAIKEGEIWAFRYYDSWGNLLPHSRLTGAMGSLGEYDECLAIESLPDANDGHILRGKYCLVKLILPLPEPGTYQKSDYIKEPFIDDAFDHLGAFFDLVRAHNGSINYLGICLPNTCDPIDIQNLLNIVLYPILKMPFQVGPDCQVSPEIQESVPFTGAQKIVLSIFAILILIVLLCTAFHGIALNRPETGQSSVPESLSYRTMTAFSLITTQCQLVAPAPPPHKLASAEAVGFLALMLQMLCHHYTLILGSVWMVPYHIGFFAEDTVFSNFFNNNWPYVLMRKLSLIDFYFVANGLITAYDLTIRLSAGRFNYFRYVLVNYLRLVPVLVAASMSAFFLPLVGDGPFFNRLAEMMVKPCDESKLMPEAFCFSNWMFQFGLPCNFYGWLISAQMQLTLLAPLLVIPMHRRPSLAIFIGLFHILLGCLLSAAPYLYGIPALPEMFKVNMSRFLSESLQFHYFSSLSHLSPFAFGLLLGYLVKKSHFGGRLFRLNSILGSIVEWLFWLLSAAAFAFSLVWMREFSQLEFDVEEFPIKYGDVLMRAARYSDQELLLFTVFDKLLLVLVAGFLMFLCCTGKFPSMHEFFASSYFRPWTRMVRTVFLVSGGPIFYRIATVREMLFIDDDHVLSAFVFDTVVSTFLAWFLYLLVEGPINNLVEIFFEDRVEVPKKKEEKKEAKKEVKKKDEKKKKKK